jgi:hypothetical protein
MGSQPQGKIPSPWISDTLIMPLKGSIITGIVRGPDGNPIPLARISFTGGPIPLQDIAALTDRSGKFSLTAPAEGTYTIRSIIEGFEPAEVQVVTGAGAETRVEIMLKGARQRKS